MSISFAVKSAGIWGTANGAAPKPRKRIPAHLPQTMIRETDPPSLPTPDERPDADLVVYDGECSFCIRQVQRLARWDSRGRLAFVVTAFF